MKNEQYNSRLCTMATVQAYESHVSLHVCSRNLPLARDHAVLKTILSHRSMAMLPDSGGIFGLSLPHICWQCQWQNCENQL